MGDTKDLAMMLDAKIPIVVIESPDETRVLEFLARFAHDHAGRLQTVRLEVVVVYAVVADQGVGEEDDLASVGGVAQDLLVAGHAGVENDLAGGPALRSERPAFDHRTVCENEVCGHWVGAVIPSQLATDPGCSCTMCCLIDQTCTII